MQLPRSEISSNAASETNSKAVSDLRLDLDMRIYEVRFPTTGEGGMRHCKIEENKVLSYLRRAGFVWHVRSSPLGEPDPFRL